MSNRYEVIVATTRPPAREVIKVNMYVNPCSETDSSRASHKRYKVLSISNNSNVFYLRNVKLENGDVYCGSQLFNPSFQK